MNQEPILNPEAGGRTKGQRPNAMNAVLHEVSPSIDAGPRCRETTPSHDILYVEDDAVLRSLFAELLSHTGYRVEVARDGQAGWEALQRRSYDLLITDNEMPRLSGRELIQRLRSAGNTLPAVVASGSYEPDEDHRDDSLGVAATLRKPFHPEELLNTVNQVLRPATAVRPRDEPCFPFPAGAEAFAYSRPAPRWGINE